MGLLEDIEISKIISPLSNLFGSNRGETSELASSIAQKGLLQPIIVRSKDRYFEIVAGNRRFLVCKALGWRKIVCHIVEVDDREAFEISLTENIQRKSLEPLEEAKAFRSYVQDYGWGGVSELSSRIGKSPSYVCKRLSLLSLSPKITEYIEKSLITTSAAEELITLPDENRRCKIAEIVVKNNLSIRDTRNLVRDSKDQMSVYDFDNTAEINELSTPHPDRIDEIDRIAQRSFDKSITILRIAMNKIATILEDIEDNWIVYETLMQHKNMLHGQIDLLIKQKRKL